MTRIAAILTAVLVVLLGVTAPAQASKQAEGRRHQVSAWIAPPSDLDSFRNIYGGRATGFVADHIDPATNTWVNTTYSPRHVMLFQYCETVGKGASDTYACQSAWESFYSWLRDHRDGTMQDWIDQQYPHS